MPRFTTLYSGSSGNCAVAEQNGRFLLVDMGGSCKATLGAMLQLGLQPRNLCGILLTHEHSDHIKGLKVFLKKVQVPVFGTRGTLQFLWDNDSVPPGAELVPVEEEESVELADFLVRRFATSHDAAECCGWHLTAQNRQTMAIATDLGCMTPEVLVHFEGVALAALEANYDEEMLRTGPYPYYLKKRISCQTGHLSNADAATTVARLVAGGTHKVALCHLSKENNHPDLVRKAIAQALLENGVQLPQGCTVRVAQRFAPDDWMEF